MDEIANIWQITGITFHGFSIRKVPGGWQCENNNHQILGTNGKWIDRIADPSSSHTETQFRSISEIVNLMLQQQLINELGTSFDRSQFPEQIAHDGYSQDKFCPIGPSPDNLTEVLTNLQKKADDLDSIRATLQLNLHQGRSLGSLGIQYNESKSVCYNLIGILQAVIRSRSAASPQK